MLFLNSWRVSSHKVRYGTKAQGKLGNIVAETLFPTNVSPCFPEWANTSWETLVRNIGKHQMFLKVCRKHFCFLGSKFCFCHNVSTSGQTWKHLRKHRESQMFPQQCFLVCPGLNPSSYSKTAMTLERSSDWSDWTSMHSLSASELLEYGRISTIAQNIQDYINWWKSEIGK
jgi:hypothetical protein